MTRIVPRGFTSCADAYLTPHVKKYVEGFCKGFKSNLQGTRVLFMQSDGGLTPMQHFNGARAILSGPAGGRFISRTLIPSSYPNFKQKFDVCLIIEFDGVMTILNFFPRGGVRI